ncbi:MAG: M56 family metallopeptidase [Flavobacteriaceae bacterium]
MHQFKRFYLLGVILASIIIPFITFTTYVESQPVIESLNSAATLSSETAAASVETSTNYLPIILWSIYGIGVLLFGLKFVFNLSQMILKIKRNPKLKNSTFINVLLQDLVSPHTFFSYIFLNKHKYETHQIPEEVLLHEQTHAKQRHSIDILFIEFLQVIFWFNPLIHFIKNTIKLNHEFLADKAVLNKGIETTNYQNILLAFSTKDKGILLANAINYSSIKKRITVMKTQTSNQKIWLRSLVLLPLLALTLYSFSNKIEIVEEKNQLELLEKSNHEIPSEIFSQDVNQKQDGASREQMKEYERLAKHYNSLPKDQLIIKKEDLERMKYIYHLMSDKQKKDAEPFPVLPPPPAPEAVNPNLPPPPPPPIPENATPEQKIKYKKATEEYNKKYKVKNGQVSEKLPPPPPPIPDNATPEQRKKYEEATRNYKLKAEKMAYQDAKLAKIKAEKGELTRARELNKEEVAKLKKEKEAYKNREKLKLAEARNAKTADVEKLKKEKLAYKEAQAVKLKTEKRELAKVKELRKKEDVQKLKQEKLAYAEAQRAKLSDEERLIRVREIETPKPPKSPLDHVIDMAKKDAKFYLEGKEISSDQAIKTLKENKHLNIKTIDKDAKQPKVYITKNPIVIEN